MFLSNWNRLAVFAGVIQFIDLLLERGDFGLVYRAGICPVSRLQKAEKDYGT
jgi:hypothetical protein